MREREWILGIETSGAAGSIALGRKDGAVFPRLLPAGGRRHAQSLVSEVMSLLASERLTPSEIQTLGVSVGPGSFTGLRVGVVFAKTWAYATGCRLVAVDTHLAIARRTPADLAAVWVLSDAQRGDVYASRYVRSATAAPFLCDTPIAVHSAAVWLSQRLPGEALTGPGAAKLDAEAVREKGLTLLPESDRLPTASGIVELARLQSAADEFADLWTLEPFYCRKSAAEETWDALGR